MTSPKLKSGWRLCLKQEQVATVETKTLSVEETAIPWLLKQQDDLTKERR